MSSEIMSTALLGPGAEVGFINLSINAPTVFCDGMMGIAIQPHITKVSFFEQIPDPSGEKLNARFVVNLAFPNDQFLAIANLLKEMADAAVKEGSFGPAANMPHRPE